MKRNAIVISERYPLAGLTTFNVGGIARYYAEIYSEADVKSALDFAAERRLEVFVLGGGSNLLISDEGFNGLVLHNRIGGFKEKIEGRQVFVSAGAGEDWQDFVRKCVDMGWQGVECLAGVPGTVGAAPVQNIGAYGQDVSESVIFVKAVELTTGRSVYFSKEECDFSYRSSLFNSLHLGRYFITEVGFSLSVGRHPEIRYKELERRLGLRKDSSLRSVYDAVMDIRAEKGLLVREGVESHKCAGSFFKNPILTERDFLKLEKRLLVPGECSDWSWPLEGGLIKVSAARLIERAGFNRGYREGNTGISSRHALIIVNYGGARASEIASFAANVRKRVFDEFGVLLEPEVRLIGFPDNLFKNL